MNFRPTLSPRVAACALAASAGGALAAAQMWHPASPPRYQGLAAIRARAPQQIAGFTLQGENEVGSAVRAALASADLMSRTYRDAQTGQEVDFTLIGGTDRNALHDPRSCLIGAGWRIENDHRETIAGSGGTFIRACRIVSGTELGAPGYDTLYLYVVSGRPVDEVTQIRAQMLASALIGRKNTPVCFVRFMRPRLANPAADQASRRRFDGFVAAMWNTLDIPRQQMGREVAAARPRAG